MTPRLLLAGATLAAGFLTPAADAACYGATGVAVACTRSVPVYSTCVYTGGSTCDRVELWAPLCVGGTIGTSYFTTSWC